MSIAVHEIWAKNIISHIQPSISYFYFVCMNPILKFYKHWLYLNANFQILAKLSIDLQSILENFLSKNTTIPNPNSKRPTHILLWLKFHVVIDLFQSCGRNTIVGQFEASFMFKTEKKLETKTFFCSNSRMTCWLFFFIFASHLCHTIFPNHNRLCI